MTVVRNEEIAIQVESDLVIVRQRCRDAAKKLGFSLVNQTKLVTAASELARNTLNHGHGGTCSIEILQEKDRTGLRLIFRDDGPGIKNVAQALEDGFTTTTGLGLGLGGAKRLVDEMEIESVPGEGTTVKVVRWK